MRPERIQIQAFGCYAETQDIDFGQLGTNSLFLIHGPTGAGKTTVLDALCFALYGESSGRERRGRDLRSDHASADLLTEIVLDFSIGEKSYRVRRAPEQSVPLKRKEGERRIGSKASLWDRSGRHDLDEEGCLLTSRVAEVTGKIEELLGCKADEFRQVILIPQGQFRRLLNADVHERRGVLESLFRADYYRSIETSLKDAAGQLRSSVVSLRAQEKTLLDHHRLKDRAKLAEERQALHEKQSAQRAALLKIRKELEVLRAHETQALERKGFEDDLKAASEISLKLEGLAPEQENRKLLLEAARRAAPLEPLREELSKRDAELEGLSQRQARAIERNVKLQAQLDEARTYLSGAALSEEKELALQKQLAELETRREYYRVFREADGEHERALEKLVLIEQDCLSCDEQFADSKGQLEVLQANLREQEALIATQEVVEVRERSSSAELKVRAELKEISASRERAGVKFAQIGEQNRTARSALQTREQGLVLLRRSWRNSQAALLAAQLDPGEACPVCGSEAHPSPCQLEGESVGVDAIEAEDAELRTLREQLEQCIGAELQIQAELGALEKRERDLSEQVVVAVSDEELLANHADLGAKLDRICSAAQSLPELHKQISALQTSFEKLQDQQQAFQEKRAEGKTLVTRLEGRLVAATSAIPEKLRIEGALELETELLSKQLRELRLHREHTLAEVQKHERLISELQGELSQIEESLQADRFSLQRLRAQFHEKLMAASFVDEQQVIAALRQPEEIEKLDCEVRDYHERLRSNRDRVLRLEERIKAIVLDTSIAWSEQRAQVEANEEQLIAQIQDVQSKTETLEKLAETLDTLSADREALELRFRAAGHIAEIAQGNNPRRLGFQTFVLGAMFDDVLGVASRHLETMSRGRYLLKRSQVVTDRRSLAGLDLEVFDHYTGLGRASQTLSGGETFLASLSLALGLSEVVQSYSGGIRMDTMFIDEGFGSLDSDALELAFQTLYDLQASGRLVGIISHVPELKERIDVRLEVTPGQRGSVAQFVLP